MSSQNSLHDDIVAKVSVGTTSTAELDDIRSALEELLIRLTSEEILIRYYPQRGNNKFILFKLKVSKLQPCGSMQEGTSQWKSARSNGRERKYIEFDYLAVLDIRYNLIDIREGGCKGCRKLYSSDQFIHNDYFEQQFLAALYQRINFQCRCIVKGLECYSSQPDQQGTSLCSKCTAERETGFLQIARVPGFGRWEVKQSEHCSIVFLWTSYTGLRAPNVSTLQPTEIIKRLVIRTDFLPALEISNDSGKEPLLVVPKTCSQCDKGGTWLVSYCMYELKAINALSDYHRNCYSIIKFLYGQFTYWCGSDRYLKSYHAKVAFLTHCETCQAESGEYTNCVINILQSLVKTYETGKLKMPVFHANKYLNVSDSRDNNNDIKRSLVLFLIDSVHKMTTNINMTYSEIIKDTVRQIIEEGVWITTTSDGKARLEKQCNMPSSTIRHRLISSSDMFEWGFDTKAVVNKHVKRCGCSYAPSVFRFHAIERKICLSKVPERLKQVVELLNRYHMLLNSPLKTISQSITDSEMTTSTTSDSGGDAEGSSDLILDSDLNMSWSGVKETDFVQVHEARQEWEEELNSHLQTISQSITDSEMTTSTTSDSGDDPEGSSDLILDSDLNVNWSGVKETEFVQMEDETRLTKECSDIKDRLPSPSIVANPSDSIHVIYSRQESSDYRKKRQQTPEPCPYYKLVNKHSDEVLPWGRINFGCDPVLL